MAAKAKIKKTIANIGYAPLYYNAATDTYTYGRVTWFVHNEAGGREFSVNPNGDLTEIYADGVSVYMSDENHGYDIDLTLLSVVDDIEVQWLGNEVDENGVVSEYANNIERPRFALIIVEDTVDGVGITHIFHNCVVSQRPAISGKTSDASGFDPQFFQVSIAARPVGKDNLVYQRRNQKNRFVNVPFPNATSLAVFEMSGATLSPAFRSDVDEYTFTASGTKVIVTAAVPTASSSVIAITQNATTKEIGDELPVSDGAITVTVSSTIGGGNAITRSYVFTPGSGT